jgi:hypothetical protein
VPFARGTALEQLVSELCESLSGVEAVSRNVLTGFGEAELDIQLLNRPLEAGLPMFRRDVFIEGRSSGKPVNSAGVSHLG